MSTEKVVLGSIGGEDGKSMRHVNVPFGSLDAFELGEEVVVVPSGEYADLLAIKALYDGMTKNVRYR